MAVLDLLARIIAAIVAAVRFFQQPNRVHAGAALVATGALMAY